jgi:methionine biosynthesis protein MetW
MMESPTETRHSERKLNRVQKVKAQILRNNTSWLANHDPDELYSRFLHTRRVNQILDFTKDIRGTVLDIGCFDGSIAEKIQRQGGKRVIGTDRLKKALELAAARGIQVILADVDDTTIQFCDNYFDCVVMGEILDYVFDPDAVIEDVRRVMKPGGKLIITVPNLASIRNRIRLLFGFPPYALAVSPQHGYWRYFTFGTLSELLSSHSFKILKMEANVFAFPIYELPGLHRFFSGDKWERHRIFSSKFAARILPKMGENIVLLAEKPA